MAVIEKADNKNWPPWAENLRLSLEGSAICVPDGTY